MGVGLFHRDYGVDEHAKVGPVLLGGVLGQSRSSHVATRREAHNTHLCRVHTPLRSPTAHNFHCREHILAGNVRMAVGHTVVEHHRRDTPLAKPLGKEFAFVNNRQASIATTRAEHNHLSIGLGRQEHLHPRVAHIAHPATLNRNLPAFEAIALGRPLRIEVDGLSGRLSESGKRGCKSEHKQKKSSHSGVLSFV